MDGMPMSDQIQKLTSEGEGLYGASEDSLRALKKFYDRVLASGVVAEGTPEWDQIKAYRRTVRSLLMILQATHVGQTLMIKTGSPQTQFGGGK